MADTLLAGRVARNRRTGWLLIGDLVVVGIFVGLGELRHGGDLEAWLVTLGEFGLAWLVVATLLGAYRSSALSSSSRAAGRTFLVWLLAAPLGVALRAALEPTATFSPVFLLVMLATGTVLLVPWRAIVAPRLLHD